SPDGKTLASSFRNDVRMAEAPETLIHFWDPDNGTKRQAVKLDRRLNFSTGLFSPDSKLFAYATVSGEISVIDVAGGNVLHKLTVGTQQDAPVLAFSADGTQLYSKLPSERVVRQWDLKTGKSAGFFGGKADGQSGRFAGTVGCLALLPDGKTLAAGDSNAIR